MALGLQRDVDPLHQLPHSAGLLWLRVTQLWERALPEAQALWTPSLHTSFPPFERNVQ